MDCLYCEKPLDKGEEAVIKVTTLGCSSCECIVLVLRDDDSFIKNEVDSDEDI